MRTGEFSASQPQVVEAAESFASFANAVDRVIAAVFLAAAVDARVLLGPVGLLFGGPGLGMLGMDGRLRQPGHGLARPRGFVGPAPVGAYFAVPTLPAALFGASALAGSASARKLLAPALAACAGPRHDVLERLSRHGARALSESVVVDALLDAGGKQAGGVLTREDLDAVEVVAKPCVALDVDGSSGGQILGGDWPSLSSYKGWDGVAAVDGRGRLAVAVYGSSEGGGLEIEALGLTSPRAAEPVRRGKPRTRPGTVLGELPGMYLFTEAGRTVGAATLVKGNSPERAMAQFAGEKGRALVAVSRLR